MVGGRTIGDDLSLLHAVAHPNDRTLVDRGVLVGTPELLESIAIVLRESGERHVAHATPRLAGVDNDLVGRHIRYLPGTPGKDHGPRVFGHLPLEPRADERRIGKEERHGLALHVRAHQRPVRVIVLQERNECR